MNVQRPRCQLNDGRLKAEIQERIEYICPFHDDHMHENSVRRIL